MGREDVNKCTFKSRGSGQLRRFSGNDEAVGDRRSSMPMLGYVEEEEFVGVLRCSWANIVWAFVFFGFGLFGLTFESFKMSH